MIFGENNENKDNEEGIKDLSSNNNSVVSFKDMKVIINYLVL